MNQPATVMDEKAPFPDPERAVPHTGAIKGRDECHRSPRATKGKGPMPATDILANEHRVIEQVLTCLEQLTVEGIAQGRLDGDSARQAIDFFDTFADRCHHAKEEQGLFPLLEAKGFPPQAGPTGVMRAEHEEGRKQLRGLAVEVDRAAAGDGVALLRFARHAREYVHRMREHIAKEDHRLFPMATVVLTDEDQEQLLSVFERVECSQGHAGTHEKYLEIADELADRFDVAKTAATAFTEHHCGGCCHHAAVHP
jgi:hemerythrin-like domain-containing protein